MVPADHAGWALLLLTVNSKSSEDKCKDRKNIKWCFLYWQFRSCLSKDFIQSVFGSHQYYWQLMTFTYVIMLWMCFFWVIYFLLNFPFSPFTFNFYSITLAWVLGCVKCRLSLEKSVRLWKIKNTHSLFM